MYYYLLFPSFSTVFLYFHRYMSLNPSLLKQLGLARYLYAFCIYWERKREKPLVRPPALGIAQVNEASSSASAATCVVRARGREEGARLLWVGNPVACDRMIRLTTTLRSPWVYVRTTMHIRPWEPARPPHTWLRTATRAATLAGSSAHTCSDTRACRIKVLYACTRYAHHSYHVCLQFFAKSIIILYINNFTKLLTNEILKNSFVYLLFTNNTVLLIYLLYPGSFILLFDKEKCFNKELYFYKFTQDWEKDPTWLNNYLKLSYNSCVLFLS